MNRRAISTPIPVSKCCVLLKRLNEELGTTLLMVTHDPQAAALCRHGS